MARRISCVLAFSGMRNRISVDLSSRIKHVAFLSSFTRSTTPEPRKDGGQPKRCKSPAVKPTDKRKFGRPPVGTFSSLDRAKLSASDHLDIAGYTTKSLRYRAPDGTLTWFSKLRYETSGPRRKREEVPFPNGTSGFLYYYPPTSPYNHPRTGSFNHGHLRFRVTPSADPASFDAGSDLRLSSGLLWTYSPGLTWRKRRRDSPVINAGLANSLVADNLVERADIRKWNIGPVHPRALFDLHSPHQSFLLDFTVHCVIGIAGRLLWQLDILHSTHPRPAWISGVVICHFEPYSRDEKGCATSIALQIDKILEPFVPSEPSEAIVVPQEGEFYTRSYARQTENFDPYRFHWLTIASNPAKELWRLFNGRAGRS